MIPVASISSGDARRAEPCRSSAFSDKRWARRLAAMKKASIERMQPPRTIISPSKRGLRTLLSRLVEFWKPQMDQADGRYTPARLNPTKGVSNAGWDRKRGGVYWGARRFDPTQ